MIHNVLLTWRKEARKLIEDFQLVSTKSQERAKKVCGRVLVIEQKLQNFNGSFLNIQIV